MKKAIAKENMERFGRVIFKKGLTYQFNERVSSEDGKIFYFIKTNTGMVEFFERDLTKFFMVDSNQPIIESIQPQSDPDNLVPK